MSALLSVMKDSGIQLLAALMADALFGTDYAVLFCYILK